MQVPSSTLIINILTNKKCALRDYSDSPKDSPDREGKGHEKPFLWHCCEGCNLILVPFSCSGKGIILHLPPVLDTLKQTFLSLAIGKWVLEESKSLLLGIMVALVHAFLKHPQKYNHQLSTTSRGRFCRNRFWCAADLLLLRNCSINNHNCALYSWQCGTEYMKQLGYGHSQGSYCLDWVKS